MEADIHWIDTAGSTNSLLASQADTLPHGHVIAARRQTDGRGQRGNSWESEPDANLTFSLLLRPTAIMSAAQFELSMIVTLGVCDALENASGKAFQVKWPNDIYYCDSKICGILIENSLDGRRIGRSIAGIGINVNQRRFISDAPNPVSLINIIDRETPLRPLLEQVCNSILGRLAAYELNPAPATLLAEYKSRLWRGRGFHQWHDALLDEDITAEIADVAPDGILTMRTTAGQTRRYAFKQISAIL